MFTSFLLLLCSVLSFIAPVVLAVCPSGIAGSLISGLAGYGPVMTYCSLKYPVPPVTATARSTVTIIATIGTYTANITIATATSTLVSRPA